MIQKGRARTTQVSKLINPTDGYRGSMTKKGLKPKNHMNDNAKKLREAQKEFKMKEQKEIEKKREKNFKLKKFSHVKSRVYSKSSRPVTAVGPRISGIDDISKIDSNEKENIDTQNIRQVDQTPLRTSNFVKKNIEKACFDTKPIEHPRPQTASEYGGKDYKAKGKVPEYLQKRKDEWKQREIEEEKQAELSKIPPGTKLLPEDERLTTLDQLQTTRKQIVNTLETLPISMRTMSLRNKKLELECKLKEIDAAIKLFSKENVYVALKGFNEG